MDFSDHNQLNTTGPMDDSSGEENDTAALLSRRHNIEGAVKSTQPAATTNAEQINAQIPCDVTVNDHEKEMSMKTLQEMSDVKKEEPETIVISSDSEAERVDRKPPEEFAWKFIYDELRNNARFEMDPTSEQLLCELLRHMGGQLNTLLESFDTYYCALKILRDAWPKHTKGRKVIEGVFNQMQRPMSQRVMNSKARQIKNDKKAVMLPPYSYLKRRLSFRTITQIKTLTTPHTTDYAVGKSTVTKGTIKARNVVAGKCTKRGQRKTGYAVGSAKKQGQRSDSNAAECSTGDMLLSKGPETTIQETMVMTAKEKKLCKEVEAKDEYEQSVKQQCASENICEEIQ